MDPTLVALAERFAYDQDVPPVLADRLEELGFPATASLHFRGPAPCRPPAWCVVISAILSGRPSVELLEEQSRTILATRTNPETP